MELILKDPTPSALAEFHPPKYKNRRTSSMRSFLSYTQLPDDGSWYLVCSHCNRRMSQNDLKDYFSDWSAVEIFIEGKTNKANVVCPICQKGIFHVH